MSIHSYNVEEIYHRKQNEEFSAALCTSADFLMFLNVYQRLKRENYLNEKCP